MKVLFKWLARKIDQVNDNRPEIEDYSSTLKVSSHGLGSTGLSFNLYPAAGGTVIELYQYDNITNKNNHNLYVISSGEDLGQGLAHIVTMEALKK
jgi:hypothetical protein